MVITFKMQQTWYHGYITPARSKIILENQRDFSFLLRSSRVHVQEKIISYVKGGQIRDIKVIDDERNDFFRYHKLRTTDESVEKMFECMKDLNYPVICEENQAHMEIMQFNPLVCSICEHEFSSSKQLTNHKNSLHILKYCLTCKEFFQANNRQRHKDYCNKTKFTCQQCNKTFNSRSNLQAHEKLHAKGKLAYSCDICDKRFTHVEMVASHKTRVHKLKIKCGFCPKMMTSVESKNQHEKLIHKRTTGRQRKPLYECNECQKCFVRPSSLQVHKRVHDVEAINDHACGTCGHICGSRALLRRHETQHHNTDHVIPEHLVISMTQKHPVSNRRLTDFIMDVKEENGKRSITACFKKKQSATLNALIDQVVCEQVHLPNNDKDLENTVIGFFQDLDKLIDEVSQGRQIQEPIYTIGIDGGQKKLLFSLFIHDAENQSDMKDDTFSSGGVRRSLLAAVGDYVCESREHMWMLYNKLKLAEITKRRKIVFIGDMKAHCLMAGIQLKGTYNCYMGTCIKINVRSPCLGEFEPKGDLETFENHLKQHRRTGCTECQSGVGGPNIWWLDGDLRTTESCKKDKEEWKDATQNMTEEEAWDQLKHYNSQFDDPFPMTNDEKIPMQEIMPLDPLHHILLGVCIDLFSGLEREFEPIMLVFYSRTGCLKKLAKQPSKSFSGPQVKQLWEKKNLLLLEQMLSGTNASDNPTVKVAIDYLKSLKSLHVLCVSKTRDPNYMKIIEKFRNCFKRAWDLNLINNTPKAHQLLSKIHLEAHMRSGKTFWYTDTNGTERCHSGAKTFQQRHNLQVTKKIGTPTHAKKVKQLIGWWSSKNLGYNPLIGQRDSSRNDVQVSNEDCPIDDPAIDDPAVDDPAIDDPAIDESVWMHVPQEDHQENIKTKEDLAEFIRTSRLPVQFDRECITDGNCFFDAISAQFNLHGMAPKDHKQLRSEVCDFIENECLQWMTDLFAGNRGQFMKMVNYYRKCGIWAEGFVISATALFLGKRIICFLQISVILFFR